ncbi:MAG: hypothetical protein HYV60_15355 [Planctomycetia bacterium]|nr:hypothetical protein [Planctomycetia bacterium]
MRSYLALGFVIIGLLAARPAAAVAQDSVLAELYGHGVHAYFAGQYQKAHEYLTTAIEQGTSDPRTFYFRGLAYTALGRPDEAKADFTRTEKASQARYDQLQQAEGQVLRNPNRPQPASAKELVGTPPAEDPSDPFGGDAQPIQPQPAPTPAATEPVDSSTDLFGDSNTAEAMPADDAPNAFGTDATTDPFADDAPQSTAPAPAPAPSTEPAADPFG